MRHFDTSSFFFSAVTNRGERCESKIIYRFILLSDKIYKLSIP